MQEPNQGSEKKRNSLKPGLGCAKNDWVNRLQAVFEPKWAVGAGVALPCAPL
jgi:hypothetical protein